MRLGVTRVRLIGAAHERVRLISTHVTRECVLAGFTIKSVSDNEMEPFGSVSSISVNFSPWETEFSDRAKCIALTIRVEEFPIIGRQFASKQGAFWGSIPDNRALICFRTIVIS